MQGQVRARPAGLLSTSLFHLALLGMVGAWSTHGQDGVLFAKATGGYDNGKMDASDNDNGEVDAPESDGATVMDTSADTETSTKEPRPLLFIHIEKTGGSSIIDTLGFVGPLTPSLDEHHVTDECKGVPVIQTRHERHMTAAQARPYYTDKEWEQAYKFAFVRHPYDRIVSLWSMWKDEDSGGGGDGEGTNCSAVGVCGAIGVCGCDLADFESTEAKATASLQPSSVATAKKIVPNPAISCSFYNFFINCADTYSTTEYHVNSTETTPAFDTVEYTHNVGQVPQIAWVLKDPYLDSKGQALPLPETRPGKMFGVDFIGRTENIIEHLYRLMLNAGNSEETARACADSLLDENSSEHEPFPYYYEPQTLLAKGRQQFEVDSRAFNYTFDGRRETQPPMNAIYQR